MSFVRIWIHLIWNTKEGFATVSRDLKHRLLLHIRENAKVKGIYIKEINCVSDHVHALISLGTNQKIADVARLLKGESSHWINTNKLTNTKFEWREEYYAGSVSESLVPIVRKYIREQEQHHRKLSFSEEVNELVIEFGLGKAE